jgi:hypothetical protein
MRAGKNGRTRMKFFLWAVMLASLGVTLGCANRNQPVVQDNETMQQHMGY